MSKIEELEKRIIELEAEVVRLKAQQPQHVIHSHYHYPQPAYIPAPSLVPLQPGYPQYPQITWHARGAALTAG